MTSNDLDLVAEYAKLRAQILSQSSSITPSLSSLAQASDFLAQSTTSRALGAEKTLAQIREIVVPALNSQNLSSRYYGFVTGSSLPAAEAADNIVSALDQNVVMHLDGHSIAAELEKRALELVVELLDLGWDGINSGKVFTTGATASNILGLACARESIVNKQLERLGSDLTVASAGLFEACRVAGIQRIQILSSMPHSSILKAASVVGLGTANVVNVAVDGKPWRLDLDALEERLKAGRANNVVSIVVVGAGEVNTGRFAIQGKEEMQRLRDMVDQNDGWLHLDGAFGIFARILPATPEFETLRKHLGGIELADSITIDGHKVLNVPYDCGIFLCRHLSTQKLVFSNPNAAYLSSTPAAADFAYLNLGLENSRRFRALPAFATIVSEGAAGLGEMHARMVRFTRKLSQWIQSHERYELLPVGGVDENEIHIITLFRHRDEALNESLVRRINDTKKLFVSPTAWDGRPAVRLAVSSWRVDVENDFREVTEVLDEIDR